MPLISTRRHPFTFGSLAAFIAIFFAASPSARVVAAEASVHFKNAEDAIQLEARSRRKWDNPLVADLDQDGRPDLVLTDHSRNAQVHWNEGGTFSKPKVIVRGDTHGVAVGDYDRDGRIDLIFSQGGGGGDKPRNPVCFQVNRDRSIEGGDELSHFERSRGRAAKLIDADNNGTLDLLLTAFPLKTQP